MRIAGIFIILLSIVAPLVWFIPLAAQHDPVALFSQYLGAVALIVMGLSQLLATRFRWLEFLFGGLDRIYVLHKWLGISAMVAILLHDTIDAEMDGLGSETFLSALAETLGEISLYSLLILVVITLTTFIPYHIWRLTHKFIGALFALAAFHFVFILKPFAVSDPLGLYITAFCLLGIISYLYTLLPFEAVQGRFRYKVATTEHSGDSFSIILTPEKRGLSHRAGQFAFFRFEVEGRKETHPFTISKGPEADKTLRVTIKPLGDSTRKLVRSVSTGTKVRVSPAFGHFSRSRSKRPEIWIAGGIGVTPFAAFVQDLPEEVGPIHFFYCVSDRTNAAHIDEFESVASRNSKFNLHLIESNKQGRLNVDQLEAELDCSIPETLTYFCGPKQMREELKKEMMIRGLSARNYKFEEFEIRSSIGLEKLFNYLFNYIILPVVRRVTNNRASLGRGR